jgi:SAM-dependent methyltransferase
MRDTDADWRVIGATEPFWGVITAPEFKMERLSPERLRAFYDSGIEQIKNVTSRLEHITGEPIQVSKALDFGCGVGRLSEAMLEFADQVIGVDISPNMLEAARRHSTGNILYFDQVPDGKFGWINAYVVFQHIPPRRGMAILESLLQRLEPGALISLHFTIYRDVPLDRLRDALALMLRMWSPPKISLRKATRRAWRMWKSPQRAPLGTMFIYDYDLNRICAACHQGGIEELMLIHTNHGGHHGVEVFGRRIP